MKSFFTQRFVSGSSVHHNTGRLRSRTLDLKCLCMHPVLSREPSQYLSRAHVTTIITLPHHITRFDRNVTEVAALFVIYLYREGS